MLDLSSYRPVSFSSCENPYFLHDVHGRLQKVRCGKCSYCKQSYRNRTSSLLSMELSNWRYAIFFTLTYNNKWLPKVTTYRDDTGFLVARPDSRISKYLRFPPHYLEFDYVRSPFGYDLDVNSFHENVRIPIISNYSDTSSFGVLFYRDVQLFKKRFIKSYFNYVKSKYPEIFRNGYPLYKIYYCGEYGSVTFRPHYHFIFMFDEPMLVDNLSSFRDYVFDSWSFRQRSSGQFNCYTVEHFADYARFTIQGEERPDERPNFSFVETSDTSSVASYVSSYTTSFTDLPHVLQHHAWCAKTVVPRGKYGAFGSFQNENDEILQKVQFLANGGTPSVHLGEYFCISKQLYNNKSQSFEFVNIPYSKSHIRTLFCKPYGYSKVSHLFIERVFQTVFTNLCRQVRRLIKIHEYYSFSDFFSDQHEVRSLILFELLDDKEFMFFYRNGLVQESFWLFLRNGFRTMFHYHLDVRTYINLFFYVHDILIPQCRLYSFYTEQDLLIKNGYDVISMYDDISNVPLSWFKTFPSFKYSSAVLLTSIRQRYKQIMFTHYKHHSRSNIS